MTRGNLIIIDKDSIIESIQFNGDMYPEGKGLHAIEVLVNSNTSIDFLNLLEDFDDKYFHYRKDYGDELFNTIYYTDNTNSYLDFSQDYYKKFNSDYIYIKNISDKNKSIVDKNNKTISIKPNEIIAFYFGKYENIDEFIKKAKENLERESNKDTICEEEILKRLEERVICKISYGDAIRKMTDKELAIFLSNISSIKNIDEMQIMLNKRIVSS